MNIEGGDPQSAVLLSLACHVTPRLSTMPNDLKDRRRVVRLGRAAVRGNVVLGSSTNGRRAGGQVTFLPPPTAAWKDRTIILVLRPCLIGAHLPG